MSQFGWRWWDINKLGQLVSVNNVPWSPDEQEDAECLYYQGQSGSFPMLDDEGEPLLDALGEPRYERRGHAAPEYDCRCGYWAFWDPEIAIGLPRNGGMSGGGYFKSCKVFGVIEAWGEICHHDYGFRAQTCTIRAFTVMRGKVHPAYAQEATQYGKVEEMIKHWDFVDHNPYDALPFNEKG